MEIHRVLVANQAYSCGVPGQRLLFRADKAVELLEACANHSTDHILLFEENLPDRFFDLSSGQLGEVLQKLRNYSVRLAVVVAQDRPLEGHLADLIHEEERGGDFRVFLSKQDAEEWLVGRAGPGAR